jgi:DNA adenine methylase
MGSKRLLKPRILPTLMRMANGVTEYRELFAGSAQIGITMMSHRPDLAHSLNDLDPSIAALWLAVRDHPQAVIDLIRDFCPSVPVFREFKSYLGSITALPERDDALIELGFCRLAIAYLYHSGYGSGCRGGYNQTTGDIGEQWSAGRLSEKVVFHHRRLRRIGARISCQDFQSLIKDTSSRSLLFCDPPFRGFLNYYGRKFTREDHQRLADLLGTTEHAWGLTYGDHPDIRRLYSGWAHVEEIGYRNLLITR